MESLNYNEAARNPHSAGGWLFIGAIRHSPYNKANGLLPSPR